MRPLEDVHIFNGIMPSGICQAGAAAALSGPQDWLADLVATFQRGRDALLEELAPIEALAPVEPEGGYFFIASVAGLGVRSAGALPRSARGDRRRDHADGRVGSRRLGRRAHVRFIFTDEPEERLREAGRLVREFLAVRA